MSPINSHPELHKIIDLVISGVPVTKVAKMISPPVAERSLYRYAKQVILPAIARGNYGDKVKETKPIAEVAGVVARSGEAGNAAARHAVLDHPITQALAKRAATFDEMVEHARKKKDLGGFAAAVNAETRSLEVQAKLAGLFAQAGDSDAGAMPRVVVHVQVNTAASAAEQSAGQVIDCEPDPTV